MKEFNILLHTLEKYLSQKLPLIPRNDIQITKDERVPPDAGQEFINLYGLEVTNNYDPIASSTWERVTLTIGITRRLQGRSSKSIGPTVLTNREALKDQIEPSMFQRVSDIRNAIENDWGLINEVNTEIGASGCSILGTLRLVSSDTEISEVDELHFQTITDENRERPVGYLLELTFGGPYIIRGL